MDGSADGWRRKRPPGGLEPRLALQRMMWMAHRSVGLSRRFLEPCGALGQTARGNCCSKNKERFIARLLWLTKARVAQQTRSSSPIYQTGPSRFVSALVTNSTVSVFSPGDRPPASRLYIITEGVALHKMFTIIGIGDSWGSEDVLLAEPPPPKRETKAMT